MKGKNSADADSERLAQAADLIRSKHYAEARALLKRIKHPKAREWLAKLDEIAPEKRKSSAGKIVAAVLIGVVVTLCGLIFLVPGPTPKTETPIVRTVSKAPPVAAAATNATAIPAATATITETVTPSATITETPIPTVALPTLTPAPEERIKAIAEGVLGADRVERVSVIDIGDPKVIAMDFPMFEGFSGYEVEYTGRMMLDVACALRDAGYGDYQLQMSGMVNLVNKATGQESRDDGLTIRLMAGTSATWDCSNTIMMDAALAADEYILHPLFQ